MSVPNPPPNFQLPSTGNWLFDALLALLSMGGGAKLWHHYQTRVNAKESREAAREKLELDLDVQRDQLEIEAARQRNKELSDSIVWTREQYSSLSARVTIAEQRAVEADAAKKAAESRAKEQEDRAAMLERDNAMLRKQIEESRHGQ